VPDIQLGYDPCAMPGVNALQSADDFADFTKQAAAVAPQAGTIYLDYRLILRADRAGFDLVGAFHASRRLVDAWTLNPNHPDAAGTLALLLSRRVDQITTDEPAGLEDLWSGSRTS
jgi:glycerophosphoryl diester phosphodiesterase